jgi:hypothetical protein
MNVNPVPIPYQDRKHLDSQNGPRPNAHNALSCYELWSLTRATNTYQANHHWFALHPKRKICDFNHVRAFL